MIYKLIFFFLLFTIVEASANIKERIIQNLKTTNNLTFNFEQNVNGKTENGHCALSYPQKIFCKYNLKNNKILQKNIVKMRYSRYRISICQKIYQLLPKLKIKVHHKADVILPSVNKIRFFFNLISQI